MADINSTLPVTDSTDGTIGATAPTSAQLVGGRDGSSNLQPLKINSYGEVVTEVEHFSSKLKIIALTTIITLPSGGYTTVYTYSGSGLLIGFNMEFSNTNVIVRVVVDGDTLLDLVSLSTLNSLLATSNNTARYQSGSGIVTNSSAIDFSFRSPIKYNSSITISADPNSGLLPRNFTQGIVYLTKET